MKTKLSFFVAPILAVGCIVAGLMIARRPTTQVTDSKKTHQPPPRVASPAVVAPIEPEPSLPEETAAPADTSAPPSPPSKSATPAATANPGPQPRENRRDPIARDAMALVGMDPEAEAYWLDAINDPTLSDSEREDLIEDLNENGYSAGNGSRATVEDLPLIVRRIQIVEELWPYAMDENNWKSFQEVHKDLTEMYARLSGE